MKARVELVYFEGCPNIVEARQRVGLALQQVGLSPDWQEWDTTHEDTPEEYARFGSPTVLVDGVDVSGAAGNAGMGCVVGGGPAVATIVSALLVQPT